MLAGNRAAIRAYEKAGFQPLISIMEKPIRSFTRASGLRYSLLA